MSLRNGFGVFFFALTFVTVCAYSFAEQSTTDSPCATPDARPPRLKSFDIKHPVELTDIQSTIEVGVYPPTGLPLEVWLALFPGFLDNPPNLTPNPNTKVHNRITYDHETHILNNDLFLVENGVEAVKPFAFIDVRVDKVYTSCRPRPSVMLVGIITDGFPVFLPPAGDPYAYSFSYTTDTPPQFTDLVSLAAGLAVVYHGGPADIISGSITFKARPSAH
jgi:hypothetical protein